MSSVQRRVVNSRILEIPKARRGVYLASVRPHMERVAHKLDATGLSRLAWLFLLEENVRKGREYANQGCAIDPTNRLLEERWRKALYFTGCVGKASRLSAFANRRELDKLPRRTHPRVQGKNVSRNYQYGVFAQRFL